MHYLYAIAAKCHPEAEGLRGVLGLRVQCQELGDGICLYFSLLNEEKKILDEAIRQAWESKAPMPQQSADSPVWQHLHVWRQLRQLGPCLPFRYPKCVESLDEIAQWAAENQARVREQLGQMGLGEAYRLQLIPAQAPAPAVGQIGSKPTGTQYLMAKLQQQRQEAAQRKQLQADFALVHPQLAARAADAKSAAAQAADAKSADAKAADAPEGETSSEAAALYLVLPHQLENWKATAQQLAQQFPAYTFRITGPWPPFEFLGENDIL